MKRTAWLLFAAAFIAMLAGFFYLTGAVRSNQLTRQHDASCAEQGLPNDGCCRVGRAWVCPLAIKEPNDE
jgi:hypothetical protein